MKLYNYIGENMVFQQGKNIIIKGLNNVGDISATLTNKRNNQEYKPVNISYSDNNFVLVFNSLCGSFDEYELIVQDERDVIKLNNIYIGDVFLTAGQSNMSYSLGCVLKNNKYKKMVNQFPIFCLNILENDITPEGFVNRPAYPQEDISESFSWQKLTEDNVYSVSALSVMLALKLRSKLTYPVAFVTTSMGGVSVDTYLPYEDCMANDKVFTYLKNTGKFIANKEDYNTFGPGNYTQTAGIFNEKIYPIRDLSFKFMVWYQGENSCYDFTSGKYYYEALNQLICSYRRIFKDDKLPIVTTGIASNYYPYGDKMGCLYIQEAIAKTKGENIYYAPIYDLDDKWLKLTDKDIYYHPIHPINKEEVSDRYFNLIHKNVYLQKSYYFPYISKSLPSGNKLILEIDYSTKGLVVGSEYFGFTVAGSDNIYYSAKAVAIASNLIELTSPEVLEPIYYTYAMMAYAEFANCKTIDNMPLVQSRSIIEDYKDSTYLLDQLVLSCDFLKLRENNFGFEVGGGMHTPIFTPSKIFKSNVKLSLDSNIKTEGSSSLLVTAKPTKSSYYYFGVKVNNGLSGIISRFDKFKYLTLDIKGSSKCEFHGMAFRTPAHIYKFNVVTQVEHFPYCKLTSDFRTYSISLEKYYDGAEAIYQSTPEILNSIYSFELYFRCTEDVKVHIDNIRLTNDKYDVVEEKNEVELDTSIVIMKADN